MKIVFFGTKPYDRVWFEPLSKEYGMEVEFVESKCAEKSIILAKGADAICVFVNDKITASMIDKLYEMGVKGILLRCAGFNNVDLKACQGKLRVFRVPAYSPHAVAEHAMALLLTVNRRIHKAHNRTREFNFSLQGLTGFDLYGKTVGVIGTGKIGRVFADICRGFGMKILAYDKFPAVDSGLDYVELDELFEKSDVISLHCPLTVETDHLIRSGSIRRMKDGVIILNFARDALVDDDAMAEALASRKVKCYVTDFPNEKSANMPGCIAIPHLGASTEESEDNCARMAVQQMMDYLENGNIKNSVNFPACDMGICRTAGRITILHKNIPNTLSPFTTVMANENINIDGLMNKSRGEYAYTMLDLDHTPSEHAVEELKKINGVIRVRVIR